jgi:hypothetical protein
VRAHRVLALLFLTSACGNPLPLTTPTVSNGSGYRETNWEQPAVRIVFHKDHFTDLEDFRTSKHTSYRCLGDATRFCDVSGDDYAGSPSAFPTSTSVVDDFTVSTHPAFLKAVSVDITQTYFPATQANIVQTDGCAYRGIGNTPLPSSCADFDRTPAAAPSPTIAPTATPNPTPIPVTNPTTTQYYNTDFYRVRDDWCAGQGPILSSDPETTKSYVGGVSIDLERTELGANEDLLMVLTYHALSANYVAPAGPTNLWPGRQLAQDKTVLRVSLGATALDLSTLLSIRQPRVWSTYQNFSFPVYWQEVARFEDDFGGLRSEQVILPLSKNIAIDRVRVERERGSFHLYQIDLYRLGNRGP